MPLPSCYLLLYATALPRIQVSSMLSICRRESPALLPRCERFHLLSGQDSYNWITHDFHVKLFSCKRSLIGASSLCRQFLDKSMHGQPARDRVGHPHSAQCTVPVPTPLSHHSSSSPRASDSAAPCRRPSVRYPSGPAAHSPGRPRPLPQRAPRAQNRRRWGSRQTAATA